MQEKIIPLKKTARLAGFLFLWLIITGLTGALTISNIVGSAPFEETAKRVANSERLYRLALCSELIETLSALVLAFALYTILKPVNKLLAQMAMYWRLAESLVGCVGVIFSFAQLNVYISVQTTGEDRSQLQSLADFTHHAGFAFYNISALCFSIGSTLFFYLFLKSEYIPKVLSVFGMFASVIVTIMCFGSLIFPEYSQMLQYGWAPMAIAEVTTGFWLMFGTLNRRSTTTQNSAAFI